jgi:hypothetical protein
MEMFPDANAIKEEPPRRPEIIRKIPYRTL